MEVVKYEYQRSFITLFYTTTPIASRAPVQTMAAHYWPLS
ncbi:hypothetical protein AXZ77_2317 [Thioclava sp. ES.031]|nr:hypothetical protein AXZ77_2317 [Thioclava sp. ES.031]